MPDSFQVDLTGYKDKIGQRVPPGRYRVLVDDAETDTSSNGNQMVNLWLRVTTGDFKESVIVDRLVLTEKSLFRVVGFMQALGLPTPKRKLTINLSQFRGKLLEVDIDDGDPYNGRVKSEVRGYLKIANKAAPADLGEDTATSEGMDEFAPNGKATYLGEATGEVPPAEVDLESLDLG